MESRQEVHQPGDLVHGDRLTSLAFDLQAWVYQFHEHELIQNIHRVADQGLIFLWGSRQAWTEKERKILKFDNSDANFLEIKINL